jgi:GH15 family glucan-1,4-alpha-glucosidase
VYKKISDYRVIGNLHSVALIGLDGSIDWLCLPHIDSPSVFAALLDDKKGGRFSISPMDDWDSVADYLPGTNILVTKFRTRDGLLQLTDLMPLSRDGEEKLERDRHELVRRVEVIHGKVPVRVIFEPRRSDSKSSKRFWRRDGMGRKRPSFHIIIRMPWMAAIC